ncbi:uncharacterized protein K441DRAFT_197659 [Cenococcum geophilum 1.58]|uniref:uncharacterized protein n=1 Tax=Cenococcum geophilum 1.58 TaxID=794803 RepID=UPI00358F4A0F|nr:hypothetical protein K441DRAFT_197659 [Cenococcum geophilum 1.58]
MRMALGWSLDQVIDSSEPASVWKFLQRFSRLAIKYKQEYGKVLVLIINNANRLAQTQQGALNLFQDYAKFAANEGTVTVVFVSSKGRVLCYMIERSSWSRVGQLLKLAIGRIIHLKSIADEIERNGTLKGMCTACYAENRVSFSPPLQLCARRCSTPKDNSSPLKFFLDVVITRRER